MQCYRSAKKRNMFHSIFAAGITLLLASASQAAPSSCKALESEKQCGNSSDCAWVQGYTTKSGTKVKAYCRNKPQKGKASKAASSNSKVAKKSEKASTQGAK